MIFRCIIHSSVSVSLPETVSVDLPSFHESYKILIQIKPELKDIGAVLREIKTYREILKPNHSAIVTATDVSNAMIELAKNERVTIIKFLN